MVYDGFATRPSRSASARVVPHNANGGGATRSIGDGLVHQRITGRTATVLGIGGRSGQPTSSSKVTASASASAAVVSVGQRRAQSAGGAVTRGQPQGGGGRGGSLASACDPSYHVSMASSPSVFRRLTRSDAARVRPWSPPSSSSYLYSQRDAAAATLISNASNSRTRAASASHARRRSPSPPTHEEGREASVAPPPVPSASADVRAAGAMAVRLRREITEEQRRRAAEEALLLQRQRWRQQQEQLQRQSPQRRRWWGRDGEDAARSSSPAPTPTTAGGIWMGVGGGRANGFPTSSDFGNRRSAAVADMPSNEAAALAERRAMGRLLHSQRQRIAVLEGRAASSVNTLAVAGDGVAEGTVATRADHHNHSAYSSSAHNNTHGRCTTSNEADASLLLHRAADAGVDAPHPSPPHPLPPAPAPAPTSKEGAGVCASHQSPPPTALTSKQIAASVIFEKVRAVAEATRRESAALRVIGKEQKGFALAQRRAYVARERALAEGTLHHQQQRLQQRGPSSEPSGEGGGLPQRIGARASRAALQQRNAEVRSAVVAAKEASERRRLQDALAEVAALKAALADLSR